MNQSRPRWALLLSVVIAALGATAIHASSIDVQLRDEFGARFPSVSLYLESADSNLRVLQRVTRVADRQGRARFDDLAPGRYVVRAQNSPTAPYVHHENNPLAPPPSVTIASDTELLQVEMELWRGLLTVMRVTANRGELRLTVRAREVRYRHESSLVLRSDTENELRLVPGHWEFELEPAQGYLLNGVEIDGRSISGHVAVLELQSPMPPSYVTWHLHAPSEIYGRVLFAGAEVGVGIEAHLVEPGEWYERISGRGGSDYSLVRAGVDATRQYSMLLPDGRWQLRAVGQGVASSDPDPAELVVGPGDSLRQDFTVTPGEGTGGRPLSVTVLDPAGREVHEAIVELWPLSESLRRGEPIGHNRSWRGRSWLRGVTAGDWLVVAAHPEWLEATVELPGYDPDPDEVEEVEVRLRAGARIHALTLDLDDQPVSGVRLSLERIGDPPEPIIAAPELREAALAPTADSDSTGHAWLHGIWPGGYTLYGDWTGSSGMPSFVRFEEAGELTNGLRLDLIDGDERELIARVVPASGLRGSVSCIGGEPLPGLLSAVALPATDDLDDLFDDELLDRALLMTPEIPLSGPLRDSFTAGPLNPGAYHLGLQLAGHDRWTWAYGDEPVSEAAILQAVEGESIELGMIGIDCGPGIRLTPQVHSGADLPDLREIHPRYRTLQLRGSVGKRVVDRAVVDSYRNRLLLRDLPAGRARIEIRLEHPHFLPESTLIVSIDEELERGVTLDLAPVILGIGGSIELHSDTAPAARMTPHGGVAQVQLLTGGSVEFPSLHPGVYDVALCDDLECESIVEEWSELVVHAGTTVARP